MNDSLRDRDENTGDQLDDARRDEPSTIRVSGAMLRAVEDPRLSWTAETLPLIERVAIAQQLVEMLSEGNAFEKAVAFLASLVPETPVSEIADELPF